MMSTSRILAAFAATLPIAAVGIGFLALNGLGAAEAAGPVAGGVEIADVSPDACTRATWPNIPAKCLEGTNGQLRRVTVLSAF